MPSRQRKHQIKKVANGICSICTLPRVTALRCEAHRATFNARQNERTASQRRAAGAGVYACSRCGTKGHNRQTCPEAPR